MELLIGLIAGACGGVVFAGLLKSRSLGLIPDTLCGIVGGGLMVQALALLGPGGMSARGVDAVTLSAQIAIGATGGAALLCALSLLASPLRG